MKNFFLLLITAAFPLLSFAQTNQMVWNNGRMQYAQPIASMDSLTYHDETVEVDTLQFLLPRTAKTYIHDTIYIIKHDTIYIHDGGKADALTGAFSISADKQVRFSKGNLRYVQSTKTWSFADEQYDIIGVDNVVGGTASKVDYGYKRMNGTALADTIDLFGWSGDNTTAPWGISTSVDGDDYSGDFVDWGKNIGDGNTWRSLTQSEWAYLIQTRTDASSRYGIARITLNDEGQYVNGVVLLPDAWTCPDGITFKSGVASTSNGGMQAYADHQTFTLSQWQQLEQAGAVFLPAAGMRSVLNVFGVLYQGNYMPNGTSIFHFRSDCIIPQSGLNKDMGHAVRLVKDL